MKIAVIDIGSNSFILLIAEIKNQIFEVINQYFEIPRLGANLMIDGSISSESISNAIDSLVKFRQIIEKNQVDIVIPIATAVLREASNKDEVRQILSKVLGFDIKVISGEQEALYSFWGAVDNNEISLVVDVGGGSTEIIYGNIDRIEFLKSFPIGATKLKSQFFLDSFNSKVINEATNYLKSIFRFDYEFPTNISFIGVGGTITTLAYILNNLQNYDPGAIQNTIINYTQNKTLFYNLIKFSPNEIAEKYKIHPHRADVLTSGQLIYLTLQEQFNKTVIKVSTQGLRCGILKKYLKENS